MSAPRPSPQIVAHRGGGLLWPENSLMAFRGAIGLGVDALELDVHASRDGEVVVIHDPTLDRTTTGLGAVGDQEWAALASFSVRGTTGQPLPRLREVLELARPSGVGLLVEIKVGTHGARYSGMEERILGLLAEMGLLERSSVMAFEWATLERLRTLSSSVRVTGLLSRRGAERQGGVSRVAARLAGLKATDVGIDQTLLSAETVGAVRAVGLGIGVWTVNEHEEIRQALVAGVDYVTTDRPDLALKLRAELE